MGALLHRVSRASMRLRNPELGLYEASTTGEAHGMLALAFSAVANWAQCDGGCVRALMDPTDPMPVAWHGEGWWARLFVVRGFLRFQW
jgi:hypothetical protein